MGTHSREKYHAPQISDPASTAAFLAVPAFAPVTTTGLSGSAVAATTVKGSKSNSSDRAVTFGRDKLKGTTKNSGHASERSTRNSGHASERAKSGSKARVRWCEQFSC